MAKTWRGSGTGQSSSASTSGAVAAPAAPDASQARNSSHWASTAIGSGPNRPPDAASTSTTSLPRTSTARPAALANLTTFPPGPRGHTQRLVARQADPIVTMVAVPVCGHHAGAAACPSIRVAGELDAPTVRLRQTGHGDRWMQCSSLRTRSEDGLRCRECGTTRTRTSGLRWRPSFGARQRLATIHAGTALVAAAAAPVASRAAAVTTSTWSVSAHFPSPVNSVSCVTTAIRATETSSGSRSTRRTSCPATS